MKTMLWNLLNLVDLDGLDNVEDGRKRPFGLNPEEVELE
jgi:hypothetical protein